MDLLADEPVLTVQEHQGSGDREVHQADLHLARRAAAGELEAQHELVGRLLPRIRSTVTVLLGAHVDREDAVQACALEVLGAINGFGGRSSLETWARRVASRRCIKFAQSDRRYRRAIDPDVDPSATVDTDALSPLRERLPRPLEQYLDDISPLHRVALVLRHAFGYSLREIGSLTATDPNTVKARLYHGGKRLRALIETDLARSARRTQRQEHE